MSDAPLHTLIVDDERLARSELRRLLAAYDDVDIVAEAAHADAAERAIREHSPDLLLLDIQMPGASGFDLLERLDAAPHVVFVTAYDEHAIRAFEVNALDYLVKPVEPERLARSLDTVRERVALARSPVPQATAPPHQPAMLRASDRVFVKDGRRCWFVQVGEVRLFEAAGNYTRLYFGDERPLVHRSLRNLDERLDPSRFFRASRQHILNLACVADVSVRQRGKLVAQMSDGRNVELSRRRSRAFRETLGL
jgi:two-component system LytT family response regulator